MQVTFVLNLRCEALRDMDGFQFYWSFCSARYLFSWEHHWFTAPFHQVSLGIFSPPPPSPLPVPQSRSAEIMTAAAQRSQRVKQQGRRASVCSLVTHGAMWWRYQSNLTVSLSLSSPQAGTLWGWPTLNLQKQKQIDAFKGSVDGVYRALCTSQQPLWNSPQKIILRFSCRKRQTNDATCCENGIHHIWIPSAKAKNTLNYELVMVSSHDDTRPL